MAYGDDITEGLPYTLSNPTNITNYASTQEAYDVAINAQPFFLATSDEFPYRRQTAQYRKQQVDQSNEPGEQSITGWWVRAQSSFHNGEGIKFYDPSSGETVSYRFADSKGVNVWTKGEITLLNSLTQNHITTGALRSDGRPQQYIRSIKYNGTNGVLMIDEYDVDKISIDGTVTHFIDYNAGAGVYPVYAICDDGTYAYWVTNITVGGGTKLTMFKKPLTGAAPTSGGTTADEVKMFDVTGTTITNATMEFVKDRIVACFDNKVYEIPSNATALPTALYTHPVPTHVYTSITASGPAIYISGFNGIQSSISKFGLTTNGAMPTLTSSITAAELPVGEKVYRIFYYLGYMMIGTSKGIRAAAVSDQDGSISYGPLIVETTQPCHDFAARDKFVWCATGIDGEPGVIRIDLSSEIEQLRFAYANDLYYPGVTDHHTVACAFAGDTNYLMFATAYASSTNGHVYRQNTSELMSTGYIQTGAIRYSTLESKVFKTLKARVNNTNGGLLIESIDSTNAAYTIGNFAEGDFTPEVNISYPQGPQEYLSFKFTLNRLTSDATKGPVFTGYQLKALPAIPRQRLIQYPLACYDHESDAFGVQVGHEGAAYDKLGALEDVENAGDTIRIEDFRTGESYLGLIEEMQFINRTPTDKRFSGFGGVLMLTIRTI